MRIYDWNKLSEAERNAVLARPSQESRADVANAALEIVTAVRNNGDTALRSYTERFDGVRLEDLAVRAEEFAAARSSLTTEQINAIERAIDNVQRFHAAQLPQPLSLETTPGVVCERVIRPIATVGLYVPAGSAPLRSGYVGCAGADRGLPEPHPVHATDTR
jgi:histidinol dehydrogenase